MLRSLTLSLAAALLTVSVAACAPSAPAAPTSAPAKPAATTAPAPAPAAQPTAKPAAQPPAKAAAQPAAKPTDKPAAKPANKAAFDEKAVADFYRGNTVKMLVGTASGGSYDVISRALAKHMVKHIPGNPNMFVENMPGANNMIATNHMYNVGPKDGSLVQALVGSLVVRQTFGAAGVEYDLSKVHLLGAPLTDTYLLMVDKRAGVTSLQEVMGPNAKELVIGTLGPGSPQEIVPGLLRDVLGANVKLVPGYQGGSKIALATENQEVDGQWGSAADPQTFEKIRTGEWVVLLKAPTGTERPELANVPHILDLARNDEEREMFRMATVVPYTFARGYAMAPEVPQDRALAMREAFSKTMRDPEFVADARDAQIAIDAMDAEPLRELIVNFLNMSPALKDKLQPIMLPEL